MGHISNPQKTVESCDRSICDHIRKFLFETYLNEDFKFKSLLIGNVEIINLTNFWVLLVRLRIFGTDIYSGHIKNFGTWCPELSNYIRDMLKVRDTVKMRDTIRV